jgi:hypothetical protein
MRGRVSLRATLWLSLIAGPLAAQQPDSSAAPSPADSTVGVEDVGGPPARGPIEVFVLPSDSLRLGPGLSTSAREEIERRLAENPAVYVGGIVVPPDSAFAGSLLIVDGTLSFQGRTPGSVTVIGGDLFLRPGAAIGGDAVVIGGSLYGSGLATVLGSRVVRRRPVVVVREPGRVTVSGPAAEAPFPIGLERGLFGVQPEMYNRVDGLALRWGLRYVPPTVRSPLRLSAVGIFRTSRDDLGWETRVERDLAHRQITLSAAWYNLTDTSERWHRGDIETSLSAFFLGEDNRFYFDRQGIEGRLAVDPQGPSSLSLAFRNDEYRDVAVQDPFTVAADDFLPNLPIEEGTMRSVVAEATWDGRDDEDVPTRGWWGRLEIEAAGGVLEGDADFTAARIDIRRTQPVGPHRLDARLVLGGRLGGDLPEQKRYHLGGAATLPGFEGLSVRGDRAALLNLRYRIPVPGLDRFRPFKRIFQRGAWVTLLADGGDAWESRDGDPDWLGSAGIGFAGHGTLGDVGAYLVVPSEKIVDDQSDVSFFVYFGRFF